MTNLAIVKVLYTGWEGAPGVNVLHFSPGTLGGVFDPAACGVLVDDIASVYTALLPVLPGQVRVTVPNEVQIIDSESGELINVVAADADSVTLTGTASPSLRGSADMALARFVTGEFRAGRHVQGRAFIGPVARDAVNDSGNITDSARATIAGAWDGVIDGLSHKLCVYSRPTHGETSGGLYADVISVTAPAKMAILRSRRD